MVSFSQNIYLQATALELGVVTVGAFHDSKVRAIIGMGEDEVPLYIIPVGKKLQLLELYVSPTLWLFVHLYLRVLISYKVRARLNSQNMK